MDTSEIYIKMCDYSEIQGEWKLKQGDVYYLKKFLYEPDWGGDLSIKKSIAFNELAFKKGIYIHGEEMGVSYGYCDWITHDEDAVKTNSIWLLRQDQIQEMIPKLDNFQKIYKIAEYIEKHDAHYLIGKESRTMEQLWLAFYMHEKHKLVWDDKKWISY